MNGSLVKVRLHVDLGSDASDEEVDVATHDLRSELLEGGVDQVDAVQRTAPPGAKGTGSIIGDIAVAVLPALLPKLIDLLKDWKGRSESRSIKVRAQVDGSPIEISIDGKGADAAAVATLLAHVGHEAPASTKRPE